MIRFKIGWILISLTLKLDNFGPRPTRAANCTVQYFLLYSMFPHLPFAWGKLIRAKLIHERNPKAKILYQTHFKQYLFETEGRQMKQCGIKYSDIQKFPLLTINNY
jgi:hypothetical protein